MREDAAPEESAELALDEAGQSQPVGARSGRGEEGFQVLPDHSVQDRVGGGAGDVRSHGAGASGFRAVPIVPPPAGRTADIGRVSSWGATTDATERCASQSSERAVRRYDRVRAPGSMIGSSGM